MWWCRKSHRSHALVLTPSHSTIASLSFGLRFSFGWTFCLRTERFSLEFQMGWFLLNTDPSLPLLVSFLLPFWRGSDLRPASGVLPLPLPVRGGGEASKEVFFRFDPSNIFYFFSVQIRSDRFHQKSWPQWSERRRKKQKNKNKAKFLKPIRFVSSNFASKVIVPTFFRRTWKRSTFGKTTTSTSTTTFWSEPTYLRLKILHEKQNWLITLITDLKYYLQSCSSPSAADSNQLLPNSLRVQFFKSSIPN